MNVRKLIHTIILSALFLSSVLASNTFTVTGGEVFTNYWNSSNTGGRASVEAYELCNKVKIYINVDGSGDVLIGTNETDISLGGSANIDLLAADIELAGTLSDDETFHIKAIFYLGLTAVDTRTLTTTAITVNQSSPTLNVTSSSSSADYGIGDNIDITVTFSEVVTLSDGGNLEIELETGGVNRSVTISAINYSTTASETYTVETNDESSALSAVSPLSLAGTLLDLAGNTVDLNVVTNINAAKTIVVDGKVPAQVHLAGGEGTIIASDGTVVEDYWNLTNSDLDVLIPIADDNSLIGGTVQVKGFWGDADPSSAQDLGSAESIGATGDDIEFSVGSPESFGGFTETGILRIVAVVTDKAGNTSIIGSESDDAITIDQTAPFVNNITSDVVNATYGVSDIIDIDLTFSEQVTLIGNNLQVEMETGDTNEEFIIDAFGPSATVSGFYPVAEGNTTEDEVGGRLTVKSLSRLGGTLRDNAGNDATYGLPDNSNLNDNKDIKVDGIYPTIVSVTSTTLAGDYAIDDEINVTVTFSEDVTLTGGSLEVPLDGGGSATIAFFTTAASVATGTYTIDEGESSSALIAETPLISTGDIEDVAGNAVDLTAIATNIDNDRTIVIDGNIPAAVNVGGVVARVGNVETNYWNSTNDFLDVIIPIPADASLTNGGATVQLKAQWIGDMGDPQDFWTPQSISSSGPMTLAVPEATLEVFPGYVEGEVLKIFAVVTDKAGNESPIGSASTNQITIDTVVPTIESFTTGSGDGPFIPGDDINIIATFTEEVKLVGDNFQIELEMEGTNQTVTFDAFDWATNTDQTYAVVEDDESSDLSVNSALLLDGSFRDRGGNDVTFDLTAPGVSNLDDAHQVVVDGVIPTIVSVTSTTLAGDYAIDDEINVTVTFSEDVTLTGGSLEVPLDGGGSATIAFFTTAASVATGTYTIDEGESSSALIAETPLISTGDIEDVAGNAVDLTAIATNIDNDRTIVIDGNIPAAVNVGGVVARVGNVETNYWNSTNDFLDVIIPIPADASLTNGGATVQLKAQWIGDMGDPQDFWTPQSISSSGPMTLAVPEATLEVFPGYVEGEVLKIFAVVTDKAGNESPIGSASTNQITIDTVVPTIESFTTGSGDGPFIPGDDINIIATFTEEVKLVGDNFQIELEMEGTNQTVTFDAFDWATNTDQTYAVVEDDESSDLSVNSALLLDGSFRDRGGNDVTFDLTAPGVSNLDDAHQVVVDGVIPTIVSVTSNADDSNPIGLGGIVDLTVTFSEEVSLSVDEKLVLNMNSSTTNLEISDISESLTATINYEVLANDENSDLSIDGIYLFGGGSLQDAAGNDVSNMATLAGMTNLADGYDFIVDGILPPVFDMLSATTTATTGGNIKAGYWNALNDGLTVTVDIPADASLSTGEVQVFGKIASNDSVAIGSPSTISGTGTTKNVLIDDSFIRGLAGYFEGELITISAQIADVAGNTTVANTPFKTLIIDETIPKIDAITSTSNDESYNANQSINVTISMSEPVTLESGEMSVTLNTSIPHVLNVAEDLPIFEDQDILFIYDILEGETANPLDVTMITATSNQLLDIAGNEVDFTLPPTDNLADNSNIIIDGEYPSITNISAVIEIDTLGLNETIAVEIVFNEALTLANGTLDVLFDTGQTFPIPAFTSTSTVYATYTVAAGEVTTDLNVSLITLNGGSIKDDAGNNLNPASLPVGANLEDNNQILVDGNVPDDFAAGNILTVGAPVVTGYWNLSNTGVEVILDVTGGDLSLDGGTAHLEARIRIDVNDFAVIGGTEAVGTNPVTLSLTRSQFETELAGYFAGGIIDIRGVLTDIAGNSTESNNVVSILIDQDVPTAPTTGTLLVQGGNEYPGYWNNTNIDINVNIPLDEDITLVGGTIQLESDLNSASSFADIGADSTIISDDGIHVMAISAADIATHGAGDGDVMTFRAVVTDIAGNESTGTIGLNTVTVDYSFPASDLVGTVIAVENSVVAGYFNSTNTGADVTIPIDGADVTLIGGQVQLRARVDAFTEENIITPHVITDLDDVIMSVDSASLKALGFYADERVITFDAIVTDVAGNATNFNFSADELLIDELVPDPFDIVSNIPEGGNIRDGYWNAANTGVQIIVSVDGSDESIIGGGTLTASADIIGDGDFETFTVQETIFAATGTLSILVPAAELEALDGGTAFIDGQDIEFRAIITDEAGNSTTTLTSAQLLEIDRGAPSTPDITDFTIKGDNITLLRWNATSDSLLLTIPINTVADPTLVDGFFQVQMSVGTTFAENVYYPVLVDSFSIPTFDDTIRIGLANLEALPDYNDLNLYTRILIQDRAGNETIGATETEVIVIDTDGPGPFTCGPLIATGGVSVDDAYNNTNTGISLEIPIENETSMLLGSAIIRVGMINLLTLPPLPVSLEYIDTVSISSIIEPLTMTLDHATLSAVTDFGEDFGIIVSADLLDVAGNQTEGAASPDTLYIDFTGPELPVVTDTTTVGGTIVESYWNASNEGIDLTILTPVVADPSLLDGYIQIEGRIGGDDPGILVDSIPILSINITEIVASIDSVDLEALSISSEGQPIDLRITMVDGRGNDTTGAWMDDIMIMDQEAPTFTGFNSDGTTTDSYITFDDTLKADWEDFTDDVSDIAYYDYSIGHSVGTDDFLAWDTLLVTHVDTLMNYTHADEYYLNVTATDSAGNTSDALSSPVIVADLVLPTTISSMDPYYFIDAWPGELSGTYSDGLSGLDDLTINLQRISDELYWNGILWQSIDTTDLAPAISDGDWSYPMLSDLLHNREEYIISIFGSDVAGNIQSIEGDPITATLDTFEFVINTAPMFVDDSTYADSSDEDSAYSRIFLVEDPDLESISGDTLTWSLAVNAPAGMAIDSLTGEISWTPVDSAVGDHPFTAFVRDDYGEVDTIHITHRVLEVNDAPEPVVLLLPADSTQLVPEDGLSLSFKWTSAFDIEENPVSYLITWQGEGYDTTLAAPDTFMTVDVSEMDFPSSTIEWFVHALDQADTSAIDTTFHVTTSSAFASLNTDSIVVNMKRMTDIDTSFTMGNLGLTDLRWSLLSAPAWISLPAETGTIVYDTSAVIAFNINPSAYTVGGYGGQFQILTNDPLQDTITVKVTMDIFDVPTPVIAFYKNMAYPAYYEMMIVDSLGMIDSLSVTHSGLEIELTTIDTFSYVAIVEVSEEGVNAFEVYASNWVGDTTITANVTVSLIKRGSGWLAHSPDDLFEIKGSSNSAAKTSRIAVLDSMLSANDGARYKVLTDGVALAEPVLVSMPATTTDQAIYMRDASGEYFELASISDGERASAWSVTLGAFKLGPRTIIVPDKSRLSQNYPNPFNPSTTIDFDIGFLDGLNQEIRFSIYNIRGQEVRNLMQTHMQPGSYSITWNGLDDQGQQVSSGIYFARLMTGKGYAKTVKMLVLR